MNLTFKCISVTQYEDKDVVNCQLVPSGVGMDSYGNITFTLTDTEKGSIVAGETFEVSLAL